MYKKKEKETHARNESSNLLKKIIAIYIYIYKAIAVQHGAIESVQYLNMLAVIPQSGRNYKQTDTCGDDDDSNDE